MTLKPKIFLLLACIALVNIAIAALILETRTLPAFKELEATADRKDVERVVTGFDAIRNALHLMAYDYALWDDTYQFFIDGDSSYIESNYVVDTFIGNSIDLAILADRQRNILWYRIADTENEQFFPDGYYDPEELKAYFADATQAFPEAPVSRSGFINTALGAMVFSSYSVHNSDGSGESPGTLLLGRFLSNEDFIEIKNLVKVPFVAAPIKQHPDSLTPLSHRYRDELNQIQWFIADINGTPLLSLTVQLDPHLINRQELSTPAMIALLSTILSCIVVVGFLNMSILEPVLAIRHHLQRVREKGDYNARLHSQKVDELGDLARECDRLFSHIDTQNKLLEQQAEKLKQLSLLDGLTGLGNRRYLDQWLLEYWSLHRREKQPLSFLLCDIDYFKRYNDFYGHPAGDEALKRVAGAIRASLPRKTDKAARYGGEEFALLLADTDETGARAVAEILRQAVSDLDITHAQSSAGHKISLSIGISTMVPDRATTSAELVRQADIALYKAKASGRNCVHSFEIEL